MSKFKTVGWEILKGTILAAIVAGFSFLGTWYANNLSISTDYKKAINSLNASRRDEEVKKSLDELDSFINELEELKSEVNIILKHLTKSNLILEEDFYSPLMNIENFDISDKNIDNKINFLGKKIIPELQNHYKKLTKIYNIPIPEDVIKTINGVSVIILIWWAHHNDKSVISNSSWSPCNLTTYDTGTPMLWCPDTNLTLPPKEPGKVYLSILKRIDEQIKYLTEMRIRIKNGDFI